MKLEVYADTIVRPITGQTECDSCCFYKLDACDTAKCMSRHRDDETDVTFELFRTPVKVTRTISIVPADNHDWAVLANKILAPAYAHQSETRFDYRSKPTAIHIDCFMGESEFQKFLCWLLNRIEELGVNYNGI